MTIGKRIKQYRKNEGLTQEKLSNILGVSLMTVRRWEWDKRKPDIDILPKLAETLRTSVDTLLGIEDTSQEVVNLANKSWTEDILNPISAGFDGIYYKIYDGNTNKTYYIPNDEKGRKTFLDALFTFVNGHQPTVSNTITGDNNTNNKLGVVNN